MLTNLFTIFGQVKNANKDDVFIVFLVVLIMLLAIFSRDIQSKFLVFTEFFLKAISQIKIKAPAPRIKIEPFSEPFPSLPRLVREEEIFEVHDNLLEIDNERLDTGANIVEERLNEAPSPKPLPKVNIFAVHRESVLEEVVQVEETHKRSLVEKKEGFHPIFEKPQLETVFYPLCDPKNLVLSRYSEVNDLKILVEKSSRVLMTGESGTGKTCLASLLARELRYTNKYSIVSFKFTNCLATIEDAFAYILKCQLKLEHDAIFPNLEDYVKYLRVSNLVIFFDDVHLLSTQELSKLKNLNLGSTKLVLCAGSNMLNKLSKSVDEVYSVPLLDEYEIEKYFKETLHVNKIPEVLTKEIAAKPLLFSVLTNGMDEISDEKILWMLEESNSLGVSLMEYLLNYVIENLSDVELGSFKALSLVPLPFLTYEVISGLLNEFNKSVSGTIQKGLSCGFLQKISFSDTPLYVVNEDFKNYLVSSGEIDLRSVHEMQLRTIQCFDSLLKSDLRLIQENYLVTIFGIYESIKLFNKHTFSLQQQANFIEKSINFCFAHETYALLSDKIMPLLEESLSIDYQPDHIAAYKRLISICKLFIAKIQVNPQLKHDLIKQAIDGLNQALASFSESSSERAKALGDLGSAFVEMSEITDPEGNLIRAIENFKEVVNSSGDKIDSNEKALSFLNLANTYLRLYELRPNSLYLHMPVQIYWRVLAVASDSRLSIDQQIKTHLSLANALRYLSVHENTLENLEAALSEFCKIYEICSQGMKPTVLNNIGCCYLQIYSVSRKVNCLSLSVESFKRACDFLKGHNKENSYDFAVTLNNLASAYKELSASEDFHLNYSLSLLNFEKAQKLFEFYGDLPLCEEIEKNILMLKEEKNMLVLDSKKGSNASRTASLKIKIDE